MMPREETNETLKAIIRRSDLWSREDPPETVAAIMVLLVCRRLNVAHEDIPGVLLRALSDLSPPIRTDRPDATEGPY